jgi:hypothetical protein
MCAERPISSVANWDGKHPELQLGKAANSRHKERTLRMQKDVVGIDVGIPAGECANALIYCTISARVVSAGPPTLPLQLRLGGLSRNRRNFPVRTAVCGDLQVQACVPVWIGFAAQTTPRS